MKLEALIPHSVDEVQDILWAPEPVSVFEDYRDFKILILRHIEVQNDSLTYKPESFVIVDKDVYYLDRENEFFVKLEKGFESLYLQLDGYYKKNQNILTAYSSQIERLEDFLFERRVPSFFMDVWFDVKKDLSKLENFYYRNGVVYREFYRKTLSLFGEWQDEFKDIEDNIAFQASALGALKSRLDGVHHYFDSVKHEGLNKTLLSLTAISGVFLPLNLIVGFFGMNTPGLPFMEDRFGSEKVLLIIGGVLVVLLMGFQIARWLDRYVLRFLIGRYHFYHNITSKIDDLSMRLRGKRAVGHHRGHKG